jgi:membrane protease subunit (stomatin/prohibitin family)
MNFLNTRLRRLEKRAKGGPCSECGLRPDGHGHVILERIPEGEQEFCPECGRPLWTVIKVVYDR